MKGIKVIVFDLYNTLIEIRHTNNFFLNLYKSSKNGFGMDVSNYLKLVMTKEKEELIKSLPSEFETLYEKNKEELKQELNSVRVYEEVFASLERLHKRFDLYLISNLAFPYKQPVFTNKLDQFFTKMLFSCEYGDIKPNPAIFKTIENIANRKSNEFLMVGDSIKADIKGAKNVGWNSLLISRKKNYSHSGISNLQEIFDYIN